MSRINLLLTTNKGFSSFRNFLKVREQLSLLPTTTAGVIVTGDDLITG